MGLDSSKALFVGVKEVIAHSRLERFPGVVHDVGGRKNASSKAVINRVPVAPVRCAAPGNV